MNAAATGVISGLELIRKAPERQLLDQEWLERAICECGLAPRRPELPPDLHRYIGGLGIWQYPNQLAPYLIHLADKKVNSYAEIGLASGGTFMFTVEYLSRFHPLRVALGIDIAPSVPVWEYANENPIVQVLAAPSESTTARLAFEAWRPDLVFIDADHSEEACRRDYELVRSARLVGFHDLVEHSTPGVGEVWRSIDGRKREWTAQYPDVPLSTYGIGLIER